MAECETELHQRIPPSPLIRRENTVFSLRIFCCRKGQKQPRHNHQAISALNAESIGVSDVQMFVAHPFHRDEADRVRKSCFAPAPRG